jgi:hypothetical protein
VTSCRIFIAPIIMNEIKIAHPSEKMCQVDKPLRLLILHTYCAVARKANVQS